MPGKSPRRLVLICLILLSFAACRRSNDQPAAPVAIELTRPLFSPVVGAGQVAVHVTDAAGHPLDGVLVEFRGDMSHAGMAPALATAESAGDGNYQAILDLNMAGDWVVTAQIPLPDGQQASRSFDIGVTGEDVVCTSPTE